MVLADFIKEICFVIVLYKRKPAEAPAFTSLVSNSSLNGITLFVHDNSPEPAETTDQSVIYHHDPSNSGVSKAYNEACRLAVRLQKKWLLLLDQDTSFDNRFLQQLLLSTQHHSNSVAFVPVLKDSTGIVSPFRWSLGKGQRIGKVSEKLSTKHYRFANSGLLIRIDSFMKAGGYEESISLDFSDIAFGEKLKKAATHFIVVNATLQHSFSGSAALPKDAALHRFHYFCTGAFKMGETFGKKYMYSLRALLRSAYLTFQYRDTGFIKIFLHCAKNH